MSAEQNQAVMRSVIDEGFNKGNYDALDALYAPNYHQHQFGMHATLEGFKQDIQAVRTGFSDFHLTIEDMIASDDTVWIRMTARGTNDGPFMGPPTGQPMTITVMDVCRFENGRIIEHWGVPDRFAVLAQLGRLPRASA